MLLNEENVLADERKDVKKSFLYVGNSLNKTKKCLSMYNESFISKNLKEATEFLKGITPQQNNIPGLIIIDIPFNLQELSSFMSWLHASFNERIPVIYNESSINTVQFKELKKLHLVDDIVKIEQYCNRLHEKARFLKKTNEYLHVPHLSDNFHEELNNYLLRRSSGYFIKRSIDILISLVAILFFIPLFVIIAFAIKIESRGPIFYSASRAGRGFKIFRFFKFRTMIQDADKKLNELAGLNQYDSSASNPTFFKVKDDPRVTKVGAFLRNSSLDELPQLFNVLKGDMSIVGNRPLPLYEAAALTTDEWAERFMAPAGITGLWQISKRGKEDMSTEERIALDIDYARNHSLKVDLMIMLKTPSALFQKSNV